MIEIKRSSEKLYNQSGAPAPKLQEALRQIVDREIWLTTRRNIHTFSDDILDYAKNLPQYPERSQNKSFRRYPSEYIEESWRRFGGEKRPIVKHYIIIGRWAKMSEDHQKKLIYHNQENQHRILTYDQVARYGFDRPSFLPP